MVNPRKGAAQTKGWRGHVSTWAMALVFAAVSLGIVMGIATDAMPEANWMVPVFASFGTLIAALMFYRPLEWWEVAAALAANVAGGYAAGSYGHPTGFFQYFAFGLVQFLLLGWWRAWRRTRAAEDSPEASTNGNGWSRLHRSHGLGLVMEDHPYSRCLALAVVGAPLLTGLAMAMGALSAVRWLNPVLMGFCFFVITMVILKPLRWHEMAGLLGLNAAAALTAGFFGVPAGFRPCLLWFLVQFAVLFLWHAFTHHFVSPPRRSERPVAAPRKG